MGAVQCFEYYFTIFTLNLKLIIMKKLLFLLLIAPMIGNSQMLNLPVSEVVVINSFNSSYTVPQGKIAQLVSSSAFNPVNPEIMLQQGGNLNNEKLITPRLDMCIILQFVNDYWNRSTIYGNTVLSAGTQIYMSDGDCWNSTYTFVVFDLEAQTTALNTNDIKLDNKMQLFPNPTNSRLSLNSEKDYNIEVFDLTGRKIMEAQGNNLDMSNLSKATYIVKTFDKASKETYSYKVIKN